MHACAILMAIEIEAFRFAGIFVKHSKRLLKHQSGQKVWSPRSSGKGAYRVRFIRSWLADLLGIRGESARRGDWWEIDLILVLLFGSVVAGGLAWAIL